MVLKPNKTYRMCIDYRKINAIAKPFAYPLPFMDTIMYELRKARYISTMDMSSGYYQIPMHKDSIKYTAFTVPGMGLFEFLRLPFGLSGAPAVFQELRDTVTGPELEPYCFCHLDDIILATEGFEMHLEILEKILIRLRDANLIIN